jgi:hypothetical protein
MVHGADEPRLPCATVAHDEALALGYLDMHERGYGVIQFSHLTHGELVSPGRILGSIRTIGNDYARQRDFQPGHQELFHARS